ncbi:hypothetical protein, partial [Phocaeicola vulgatus]|uniref:hypothetical protein n=1 Tax=Phocaeicola vulgatus TaxID=821 RepID=UPI001E2A3439
MATKNIVNYEILCSFSIIGNCPVLGRHRLFTECEDVFGHGKYVSIRPRACFSPSYNKVKS